MAQGLLPFQYKSEAGEAELTRLAGLPLYLGLWRAAGLDAPPNGASSASPTTS